MSNKFISRNRVMDFLANYLKANEDDIKDCFAFDDEDYNNENVQQFEQYDIHFKYILNKLERGEI